MATTNRAQRRREQFGKPRAGKASGWPISAPNPVFHAPEATEQPETAQTDGEKTASGSATERTSSGQDAATVDQ
jgi:hypothetical protein